MAASVGVCALFAGSCVQDGENADLEAFASSSSIQYVFVIAMENHDASQIYGNTTDAPYINNTLMAKYARATNFNDELPSLASEPQDDQVRRRLVEGEHASATRAASATTTDRSSNLPRRS